MPKLQVIESSRSFIDRTLLYGANWSDEDKQGEPVARDDLTAVYFFLKEDIDDASPVLSLSDAAPSQIEWIDEDEGEIRIKLGTNTEGLAGYKQAYELRLKFPDGSFVTAERGTLDILDSVVDTP
jgi:hypothetical protein